MNEATKKRMKPMPCGDCGCKVRELHHDYCDVERCPNCGGQLLSCGCRRTQKLMGMRRPWSGVWPGYDECIEFGWYSKMIPGQVGWHSCPESDPDGTPDLNRLYVDAHWDKKLQRFVRNGTSPAAKDLKEAIDNAYEMAKRSGSIPRGTSKGEWLASMGIV